MFFYIPEAVVDYQLKDTKLPYRVFDRIADVLFLGGKLCEPDGRRGV